MCVVKLSLRIQSVLWRFFSSVCRCCCFGCYCSALHSVDPNMYKLHRLLALNAVVHCFAIEWKKKKSVYVPSSIAHVFESQTNYILICPTNLTNNVHFVRAKVFDGLFSSNFIPMSIKSHQNDLPENLTNERIDAMYKNNQKLKF